LRFGGKISEKVYIKVGFDIKTAPYKNNYELNNFENKKKMKQIILNCDTEYASESMSDIPAGYIDKSICACGMTTVALENDKNIVLAVPTIYLAINKADQYPNNRSNNTVLPVWGETSSTEIDKYWKNSRVAKVICTYDSLHKVKHLLPACHLIIDESNMLLSVTKQRPEAVSTLFDIAQEYKDTVSFISATPIPVNYMPDWISEIDQVKINWSNTVKAEPIICERTYPFKTLCKEFLQPLKLNSSMTVSGKTFSKVIVFLNTVSQISKVIKDANLDKEECGIICGDSLKNDSKISGIGRYRSGSLPKYLFITSSGFCGIDLIDDNAMTIIVSNTSKEWQMIDILTDLKQAISRQRNKNNPNYGSYIYIYNQSIFSQGEEDLLKKIDSVRKKIEANIPVYDELKEKGQELYFMCDNDFKAYTLYKDGRYIINEQAFNSDKYFILETRRQYVEGFNIKGYLGHGTVIEPVSIPKEVSYRDLVKYFEDNHISRLVDWDSYSTRVEWIKLIEDSYRIFKKVWKDYSYAKERVENNDNVYKLILMDIKKNFAVGSTYTRSQVKEILNEIYRSHSIGRNANHHDLEDALLIKEKKINGDRRIEIIGKKK
jgi:hypothetical protein